MKTGSLCFCSKFLFPLRLLAAVVVFGGAGVLFSVEAESASPGGRFPYVHVHALTVDAAGKALWMGTHKALLRSEDDGKTWSEVKVSPKRGAMEVMSIAPHAQDPKTIYVGTHEAGVFKTTDGGKTWAQVNNRLGGKDIHGLAFDPNFKQKLHAAVRDGADGIYRTADGGNRWERVADAPLGEVKVLTSVNISTGMGGIYLYAGTTEGLFRSPD